MSYLMPARATGHCGICDIVLDPSRPGCPTLCLKCETLLNETADLKVNMPLKKAALPKEQCPECKKWVKRIGLDQHLKDAHHTSSAQVTAKRMLHEMSEYILSGAFKRTSGEAIALSELYLHIEAWITVNIK